MHIYFSLKRDLYRAKVLKQQIAKYLILLPTAVYAFENVHILVMFLRSPPPCPKRNSTPIFLYFLLSFLNFLSSLPTPLFSFLKEYLNGK